MRNLLDLLVRTTVGRKILMALSGGFLILFVLGHLAGNLLVYAGASHLNEYAEFLHSTPKLLWPARILLLSALFIHVAAAVSLYFKNLSARSDPYAKFVPVETDLTARTMIWGGAVILVFVVFHILHLTLGVVGPPMEAENVYGNVIAGLHLPWIAAVYIVGLLCLMAHLFHGGWSFLHTLGISAPGIDNFKKAAFSVIAVVVGFGFLSIPIVILAGLVS